MAAPSSGPPASATRTPRRLALRWRQDDFDRLRTTLSVWEAGLTALGSSLPACSDAVSPSIDSTAAAEAETAAAAAVLNASSPRHVPARRPAIDAGLHVAPALPTIASGAARSPHEPRRRPPHTHHTPSRAFVEPAELVDFEPPELSDAPAGMPSRGADRAARREPGSAHSPTGWMRDEPHGSAPAGLSPTRVAAAAGAPRAFHERLERYALGGTAAYGRFSLADDLSPGVPDSPQHAWDPLISPPVSPLNLPGAAPSKRTTDGGTPPRAFPFGASWRAEGPRPATSSYVVHL